MWSELAAGFGGLTLSEAYEAGRWKLSSPQQTSGPEAWRWTGSPTWSRKAEGQSEQHPVRGAYRKHAPQGFLCRGVSRDVGADWKRHAQAPRNQNNYFMEQTTVDGTFPPIHPPITNPPALRTAHRDSPPHHGAHWQPLPQVDSRGFGVLRRDRRAPPWRPYSNRARAQGDARSCRLTALEGGPSFRPIPKRSFSSLPRRSPLLRTGGPARPPPAHSRPLELRGHQYQLHRWVFFFNQILL